MKFFYSWKVLPIKAEGWGGDYVIPVSKEEILNCSAETDFILGLYEEIENFSTWYLCEFFHSFLEVFFVSML